MVRAKMVVDGLGLHAGLILGILLFLGAGFALPQPKGDPQKDKATVKPADVKSDPPKSTKDSAKTDKDTLKPGKETVKEGQGDYPLLISVKEYQELLDKIRKLEKQLKPDRQLPAICKLTGDLRDGTIVLEAEFAFKTEPPNMVVPLGLQGGFLIDPKGLDQQKLAEKDLVLKVDDSGSYYLEVAKPGQYEKVTLHLVVPLRRSGDAAGGERGFNLTLPGAAVTTMSLGLPDKIKEIRWNENNFEKTRQGGRWQISHNISKTLDVVWKEPVSLPGDGPLLDVKSKINVKLEETTGLIVASMQLKDLRGQAREWQLFLPPQAIVKVLVRDGVGYKLLSPPLESKNQPFIIKFDEPSNEPFVVEVTAHVSRKDTNNLLVGPFFVQNAYQQQGEIVVQAVPSGVRGQRLSFLPNEGAHRREVPKDQAGQNVLALFDYWNVPGQSKNKGPLDPKVPLRIDWKADKGSVETVVDHALKMRLRPGNKVVQLELTTTIKIKSSTENYLDVLLPRPSLPRLGLLAWSPWAPFPASVPWSGFAEFAEKEVPLAEPFGKFTLDDEVLEPGKAQIRFSPVNNEYTLTIVGKYLVAADAQNFRIELPRPLGSVDRGGKVSVVSVDDQVELLMGPSKVDFKTDWDSSFTAPLDVAWRPYKPQFVVQNMAEVTIRGKEAHLRQQLAFNWSPSPGKEAVPKTGNVLLPLPANARNAKVISGGEFVNPQNDPGLVKLLGPDPLVIEFYQPLPDGPDSLWKVPLLAPEGTTQMEAKVSIWSDPGVQPEALDPGNRWQDRGTEYVPGRAAYPVLVLHGADRTLELTLRLPAAVTRGLPAMVCEKGLIQVTVDEEGRHSYQAHYLIQKLYAYPLDVEFPAPVGTCFPKITVNGKEVKWQPHAEDRNVAHVYIDTKVLQPPGKGHAEGLMLLIDYKVPANFVEGGSPWQTQLSGPILKGDVFLGRVRWWVSLPPNWVSVVAGSNVHPDFRWTVQNWLLAPEATIPAGESEQWSAGSFDPSLVFSRTSQEPFVIVHLQRQTWLLLCSVFVLAVGLTLHLLPLSRPAIWVILLGIGVVLIVGGFLWPAWGPALLFGAQPGALVLGMILGIHWVLKERYRRQVIFMPGFTRLKPGSSLLQASSRPREASTVDAPAPASAQGRGGSSGSASQPPPA